MSSDSDAALLVSRRHLSEEELQVIERLGVKETVRMGSAGVKLGRIAEGRADLFLNLSGRTRQWDTAAPEAILREAGGAVTDRSGNSLSYNVEETRNLAGVLAGSLAVHKAALGRIVDGEM